MLINYYGATTMLGVDYKISVEETVDVETGSTGSGSLVGDEVAVEVVRVSELLTGSAVDEDEAVNVTGRGRL